ncbi:Cuticle protein AMP1A [Armadillidium nasatum]|uniref:Cuticle protein AMP1A n=1 Tax=Armadillidium nasatum TaxID=96803 RepID=A0A5N5T9F4_9CRUS|nr:Cuticle protein AMP1A [Armadillidium nasatum]
MKFVVFFALVAFASAAKLTDNVQVLKDVRDGPIGPTYNNELELDNGVVVQETGAEGSVGQSNSQGRYVFVSPEGETVEVTWVANENGFQPSGPFIPQDHPLPPHAEEQLRIAEQQRAEGIEFDERGFRV